MKDWPEFLSVCSAVPVCLLPVFLFPAFSGPDLPLKLSDGSDNAHCSVFPKRSVLQEPAPGLHTAVSEAHSAAALLSTYRACDLNLPVPVPDGHTLFWSDHMLPELHLVLSAPVQVFLPVLSEVHRFSDDQEETDSHQVLSIPLFWPDIYALFQTAFPMVQAVWSARLKYPLHGPDSAALHPAFSEW